MSLHKPRSSPLLNGLTLLGIVGLLAIVVWIGRGSLAPAQDVAATALPATVEGGYPPPSEVTPTLDVLPTNEPTIAPRLRPETCAGSAAPSETSVVLSAEGAIAGQVTAVVKANPGDTLVLLQWLPSGDQILVYRELGERQANLELLNVATGEMTVLVSGELAVDAVLLDTGPTLLYVTRGNTDYANDLYALVVDGNSKPTLVATDVNPLTLTTNGQTANFLSWSKADGVRSLSFGAPGEAARVDDAPVEIQRWIAEVEKTNPSPNYSLVPTFGWFLTRQPGVDGKLFMLGPDAWQVDTTARSVCSVALPGPVASVDRGTILSGTWSDTGQTLAFVQRPNSALTEGRVLALFSPQDDKLQTVSVPAGVVVEAAWLQPDRQLVIAYQTVNAQGIAEIYLGLWSVGTNEIQTINPDWPGVSIEPRVLVSPKGQTVAYVCPASGNMNSSPQSAICVVSLTP